MRVASIIRAQKDDLSVGQWSDEKLRAKDFPLLRKKGKAFPLTLRWRWQISTFSVLGRRFRILSSYHTLIPEFMCVLAEDIGSDCRVVARWEFHQSHDGWHVHVICGDIDSVTTGIVKPLGTKRIPADGTYHRHTELLNDGCDMEDKIATAIACDLCGIGQDRDLFVKGAVPWF
ncbi:MAG: hypothetical protein H0T56_17305 [Pseudaminobacter sp.]|nr:hypothetical protein [Pseudaminobacter sp.]